MWTEVEFYSEMKTEYVPEFMLSDDSIFTEAKGCTVQGTFQRRVTGKPAANDDEWPVKYLTMERVHLYGEREGALCLFVCLLVCSFKCTLINKSTVCLVNVLMCTLNLNCFSVVLRWSCNKWVYVNMRKSTYAIPVAECYLQNWE